MKKILICTPNFDSANEVKKKLQAEGHSCQMTSTGKECQLAAYHHNFDSLILDVEVTNHSAVEVLKYFKLSKPSLQVVLYFATKEQFENSQLQDKDMVKLGVDKYFISPLSFNSLVVHVNGGSEATRWKAITKGSSESSESAVSMADAKFTRVKIDEYSGGNVTVLDLYIRLAPNKYIKIVNQGESFLKERCESYRSKGVEYVHFLTKDRAVYINYMNEMAGRLAKARDRESTKAALKFLNGITDKYLEEVHTAGIKPQLVQESKKICDNMFQLIKNDEGINNLLDEYHELDPKSFSKTFLVSFFSMVIAKNLDWVGPRTRDSIIMGSLLHDIGLLKLPQHLRDKNPVLMTPKEFNQYKEHPFHGQEMLHKFPLVTEQVRQIIYQHHELISGKGFPNGLTGTRIYPLAKIVALADAFSDLMIEQGTPPRQTLKLFISKRDRVMDFDSSVLRALVSGFIREE